MSDYDADADKPDLLKDALEAFDKAAEHDDHNRKAFEDDIDFALLENQWPERVRRDREIDGRPCLTVNKLAAMGRQIVKMPVYKLFKQGEINAPNAIPDPQIIATLTDRALIRSISERTWPSTYGHIISQEQIDFMLDWMYSDESLEKQMDSGCVFYIASIKKENEQWEDVGFCSVSPEEEENNSTEKVEGSKAHKPRLFFLVQSIDHGCSHRI